MSFTLRLNDARLANWALLQSAALRFAGRHEAAARCSSAQIATPATRHARAHRPLESNSATPRR